MKMTKRKLYIHSMCVKNIDMEFSHQLHQDAICWKGNIKEPGDLLYIFGNTCWWKQFDELTRKQTELIETNIFYWVTQNTFEA